MNRYKYCLCNSFTLAIKLGFFEFFKANSTKILYQNPFWLTNVLLWLIPHDDFNNSTRASALILQSNWQTSYLN